VLSDAARGAKIASFGVTAFLTIVDPSPSYLDIVTDLLQNNPGLVAVGVGVGLAVLALIVAARYWHLCHPLSRKYYKERMEEKKNKRPKEEEGHDSEERRLSIGMGMNKDELNFEVRENPLAEKGSNPTNREGESKRKEASGSNWVY
jgi:hypothetical protein